MILAGDIGGTKTTLALCDDHGVVQREATEKSADWASLEHIVAKFEPGPVRAACFGVAGPVVDGVAKITNLPWTIATASLQAQLGGVPVKLLNDADVQGLAAIQGTGLELVCTLGTGLGTAWFRDGELMPHMDLTHLALRRKDDFDVLVGDKTRREIGSQRWNRRIRRLITVLETVFNYDHLYLGGGNSSCVKFKLPRNVTIVSNDAGMEGGAFAWLTRSAATGPARRRAARR